MPVGKRRAMETLRQVGMLKLVGRGRLLGKLRGVGMEKPVGKRRPQGIQKAMRMGKQLGIRRPVESWTPTETVRELQREMGKQMPLGMQMLLVRANWWQGVTGWGRAVGKGRLVVNVMGWELVMLKLRAQERQWQEGREKGDCLEKGLGVGTEMRLLGEILKVLGTAR